MRMMNAMHQQDRQALGWFAACLLLLGLIFLTSLALGKTASELLIREGGIVETLTLLGYGLCLLLILYQGGWAYLKQYGYFFMLPVIFSLREMDFDKRFTTMGIFKSKFLVSPAVSLPEKAIGLLVMLVILTILVVIVKNHYRQFLTGLKNCSALSYGALITLALIVTSKSMDGIARKMESFGVQISAVASLHFTAAEEILEMGIPLILLISFYAYFKQLRH